MEYEHKFTVFTPTFNRAHTLHRVFESLKSQTFEDFEWLIIDDGSSDNTEEKVAKWITESAFPIRYYYKENQGKHIAFNLATSLAKGGLFLPWDSDDAAIPQALERFWHHWQSIPRDRRGEFSGVTCLCQDQNGHIVGDEFPRDIMDSDELEMAHRYKVRGEKWGFHRTDVLSEFPYPEMPGEYVPEGVVWNLVASKYKKRFINEMLRIYYLPTPDSDQMMSITRSDPGKHAPGRRLYHRQKLNLHIAWARHDLLGYLRSSVNYIRFSFHLAHNLNSQWNDLTNQYARFLWMISLPFGWFMYNLDKRSGAE